MVSVSKGSRGGAGVDFGFRSEISHPIPIIPRIAIKNVMKPNFCSIIVAVRWLMASPTIMTVVTRAMFETIANGNEQRISTARRHGETKYRKA